MEPAPDSTPTPVMGGWGVLANQCRNLADAVQERSVFYRRQRFDRATADECTDVAASLRVLSVAIGTMGSEPITNGADLIDRWRELKQQAGKLIRTGTY